MVARSCRDRAGLGGGQSAVRTGVRTCSVDGLAFGSESEVEIVRVFASDWCSYRAMAKGGLDG